MSPNLGAGGAWSPGPVDAGSQEQGKAEVSEVDRGANSRLSPWQSVSWVKKNETRMLLHYYDIERVIILIGIKAC